MLRPFLPLRGIAALALAALVLAGLGGIARSDERLSSLLLFAAWITAVLLLFALALRLQLRIGGPRYRAALWNLMLAGIAVVLTYLANLAVFRHDFHFDLSREAANTPPPQLAAIIESLKTELSLTYFYNSADENALKAKELLEIGSRQNAHFRARAVDLDKEPALARRFDIRAYNTAVLESADRRVVVENTVDLGQIAYAALRVLKQRVDAVCFVTGHGEAFSATPAHFHYSHVETLKGHDVPGAGDVLVGAPEGLDRLQLAAATLGYDVRAIAPASATVIPADCAVVADIGPRSAYAPGEARLLSRYLGSGGRLLLMLDPSFPITGELADLLTSLGLAAEPAVVIDPLNHYGGDETKVAVPYYPPHPITNRVALTIFPDARPIRLGATPAGVGISVLASSSADSYLRTPSQDDEAAESAPRRGTPSPAVLAVAAEGRWPDAAAGQDKPFRLVLVGNSNFASNAYFPYVSNAELVVGMVRWLAGDDAMPPVKPQSFSLAQIDLTSRQMRDIFIVVELAIPLCVVLLGCAVWWRRR